MKRKIALLMAMVFCLMCSFSAFALAEEAAAEEIAVEETTEEAAGEIAEEIAQEPADESEEVVSEEPAQEEEALPEETLQEEISEDAALDAESDEVMTLNAIDSDVQAVADAITEEMLTSDREPAYAVTKNLDMSLAGDIALPEGVTVTFTSDNEAVIRNDGTVARAIGSDTDVKVTAIVSKDGSEDAVKELNFTVLNMETALLYANNYYYPDLVNTEFVSYGNSAISDIVYENDNSGNVSTYLYPYEDGYGINVKRLAGTGVCYLDSFTNVSDENQKKLTLSTTLNIANWGDSVKRLDIELFGTTTKTVSMGKVEINNATGAIYVVPTAGSDFEKVYVSKRLQLDTDYKIDFVVDFENHSFEFLVDGENYFADTELGILSAFVPSIVKSNYYFFRQAANSEFTIKDTIVTGTSDLTDPQVALDMIDESCFTYTDSGKITEDFSFVVPETVTTLANLYGMEINVSSNKTSSISFNGYNATVTKGEEKQEVTLTVTISAPEKTVEKEFSVKVHNLAATNMLEATEPVITDDGDNKVITTSVYCDNLKEGETEAVVYLFAARKDKVSGKIDAVAVDTAVLTMGATEELRATLPDGGDSYDYTVYLWDSFGNRKTIINQPPAEPTDLAVDGVTVGTADLSWTKADDDRKAVSSYNIYRDGNLVGSTPFTNYTGENLDFGETYTFGVTAVDDSGLESEYMAETEMTTGDIPTITYVSSTPEDAPDATQVNSKNIECSWNGQNTFLWTVPAEADGLSCHETTLHDRVNSDETITKIHSYFHIRSPFSYIDDTTKNITAEITYFDEKPASNAGTESIVFTYQGGSAAAAFTDTGFWRTITFDIANAKFTEAALDNASRKYNSRFNSTTVGLKAYKASVVRTDEYVRPAASIKMKDGALILRDILVYREDGQTEYVTVGDEKALFIDSGKALEMNVETIASGQRSVKVEIKYLDEGTEKIYLSYMSESGEKMTSIERTGSGEWKTALINLEDAMLDGSASSSFGRTVDLKLSADSGVKIMTVRVY